jgi:hypothetical protein
MKELDVLLERYVRSRVADASDASADERRVLTRLLELPDPLLSDYRRAADGPPDQCHPEHRRGRISVSRLNFNRGSGSIQVATRRPLSLRE